MPADPVGGLLDGFTKIGVDYKALFADPEFRATIQKQADLLAKYTTSPLNIDDPLIANFEKQLEVWLDSFKKAAPHAPLVVGAMAPSPVAVAEAKAFVVGLEKSEGVVFSEAVKEKVAANPDVPHLLRKRSAKNQAAILNSPWLDKIIGWITTYGPTIAQFLMILVPLFL